jgi:hypothetical protein
MGEVLRGYVRFSTSFVNQLQHIKNTKACILPSGIVSMQTTNKYNQAQQSGKKSFHKTQFKAIHNKQVQPAPKAVTGQNK